MTRLNSALDAAELVPGVGQGLHAVREAANLLDSDDMPRERDGFTEVVQALAAQGPVGHDGLTDKERTQQTARTLGIPGFILSDPATGLPHRHEYEPFGGQVDGLSTGVEVWFFCIYCAEIRRSVVPA